MFYFLLRKYYKLKPEFLGFLYKLLFSNKNLIIGKNFVCDAFPKITLDKYCVLHIGNDVIFRRDVEIRVHNKSKVIIGNKCRVDRGVRILSSNESNVVLGDNVRVGLYSVFNGGDSIFIQENTLISGFVYLQTSMHNYHGDKAIQLNGYFHDIIKIAMLRGTQNLVDILN